MPRFAASLSMMFGELPLPERLAAIGLEQLATVAQAFGYMPMMEVVFRKPPASVREEA